MAFEHNNVSSSVIESLYQYPSVRLRQVTAPLLKEREQYLSHLLDIGVNRRWVTVAARFLVHVVNGMELTALRPISSTDIQLGYERWIMEPSIHRKIAGYRSALTFTNAATNWFRFHKVLNDGAVLDSVDLIVVEFEEFLQKNKGYCPATVSSYAIRINLFLRWVLARCENLAAVSLCDVDEFLALKKAADNKTSTLIGYCAVLRMFFRFAETRGLNQSKVAQGIFNPVSRRRSTEPQGPSWTDVRRLIKSCKRTDASDVRAEAIILLCSIYGFRGNEVRNLTLGDFDWIGETFFVRRAKRGKVQQFPIQYEVGEAILRYLQHFRPKCRCRSLFVSLHPPYRPMGSSGFWDVVTKRMKKVGLGERHYGPHSLRHACATELLHRGSSLKDIADFLGHTSLASVNIYAKYDIRSLRQVATFSLAGVK